MKGLIQEYLLQNWTLKVTAILLAFILWLFVRGEPGPERVVPGVPLEVQVPRQMEITNKRPTSVEVTMRGTAFSDLWLSHPIPTTCMIDLSEAKEGEHVVTLTPENVKTPKGSGIEVTRVNPARVNLVLEATVSKEVSITVPVRGEPSHGFEIYGRSSKPSTVIITGPRSHIDPVREISTEVVSIKEQKQPVRVFVGLDIKDNSVRTSLANPVQVDIPIGPHLKLDKKK
jgi:YbbR domain-containing protein